MQQNVEHMKLSHKVITCAVLAAKLHDCALANASGIGSSLLPHRCQSRCLLLEMLSWT
jgi:hypothetical protein